MTAILADRINEGRDKPAVSMSTMGMSPGQCRLAALVIIMTQSSGCRLSLGGSASTELLIAVLKEEDGEGRYGAAWSLGILGAAEAIEPLQEAARSSDYRLATLAVEALGGIGQPEALDTLRQIAEDEPSLRQSALESISSIPGEESREILEDFATSDDRTVRHTAIRSLAERRSTESIPVLVDLLDDPDSKTVEAAIGALQAITDNKTLRTAPQWKFWYENQDD